MESLKRFKCFSFAGYMYTEGRIILVDQSLDSTTKEFISLLKTCDGQETKFIYGKDLASGLEKFLKEVTTSAEKSLFVFPGNGSNFPKSFSSVCQQSNGVGVFAKRFWTPGTNPIIRAGWIMPEIFMNLGIKKIVVVDDVISSGKTMQKLYANNEWRFPGAEWIGACWLSQVPEMKSASGVKGYKQIFASLAVEGPNKRKVPINSLSTLREDKGIAENYAKRHFCNPQLFLEYISS